VVLEETVLKQVLTGSLPTRPTVVRAAGITAQVDGSGARA
jgi:hypothetical protein